MLLAYRANSHIHYIMRALFAVLLVIVFALSGVSKSFAQQNIIDEVSQLAAWKEEYLAIMSDIINLQDFETIDRILEYHALGDEKSLGEYAKAVKAWEENLNRNIPLIRERAKALPSPPAVSFAPELRASYVAEYKSLDVIVENGINIATSFKTIFERIKNGDETGVTELLLAQVEAGKKLIVTENGSLTTALLTIEKGNPQYYYLQIVLADNQFIWHEYNLTKLSILETSTQDTRAPFIEDMKLEIDVAQKYLDKSEIITRQQFDKLRRTKTSFVSQEEKQFYDTVMTFEDSFYKTFKIEKEIITLHKQSVAVYASDLPLHEIDEKIGLIDDAYFKLYEERYIVFDARVKSIAQLGQ